MQQLHPTLRVACDAGHRRSQPQQAGLGAPAGSATPCLGLHRSVCLCVCLEKTLAWGGGAGEVVYRVVTLQSVSSLT